MMCKSYYLKRQEILKQQAKDKAELWRKVRGAVRALGGQVSMQDVCQALPDIAQPTIQRALCELSRHPGSDIWHNGLRGKGSKYGVGLITIETMEE